jgi:hypothetical protein
MPSVFPLQQPFSPDDFTSELTESQPATTRAPNSARNALVQLLDRLLSTPHATGAALALASNEVLICVASRGPCAPPIGARCSRDAGLTGLCFSSGKVQLCNDTGSGGHANAAACDQLGARSVLAIPIRTDSRTVGVLEVLSSGQNAFDWRTIRALVRSAQRLDITALESLASLDRDDSAHETRASGSRSERASRFDLQQVFESVWILQQQSRVPSITPAFSAAAKPPTSPVAEPQQTLEISSQEQTPEISSASPLLGPRFEMVEPQPDIGYKAILWSLIAIIAGVLCFWVAHVSSAHSAMAALSSQRSLQKTSGSPIPAPSATEQDGVVQSPTDAPASSSVSTRFAATRRDDASLVQTEATHKPEADSSWEVAFRYLNGIGTTRDEALAAEWLKKAANQGDNRAQSTLSDLYSKGRGVPRDVVRAYTWAAIAAREGAAEDEQLAALRQQMSPSQLRDAEHRIGYWFSVKRQ